MKLVWFRNDLRTGDHHALYHACKQSNGEGVLAVAAITTRQWQLQDESKAKVQFYLANLSKLSDQLKALNIPLVIVRAPTNKELPAVLLNLAKQHAVSELFFNREYPEFEQNRDAAVMDSFVTEGIPAQAFDSDLIFTPGSILTQQGMPFKVFTPYSRAWRRKFSAEWVEALPEPKQQQKLEIKPSEVPTDVGYCLELGSDWQESSWPAGSEAAYKCLYQFIHSKLAPYPDHRDIPGITGTSSLSPYLAQGVISTRQCLTAIQTYSDDPDWLDNQWVTELIWREFYRHLIVQYPEMNRWLPFKPEIESKLEWSFDQYLFEAWCQGETGYAIVDAGMKQLNQTGWMHNRVRMITASFLTKILRQDWRLGARYFMQHLIDGDFASNLGGWQWSASVGADAAPYFRIFNPMRQAERFDKEGKYIAQWLPALEGYNAIQQHDPLISTRCNRPRPIVDYAQERRFSLDAYNAK
ncbi:cryptochrome/photolyase family protein [Neptuniibacter sp. QD29_5]|uniref:cryptochrome/photolyase family protein n=1 Tax=Neptuniibacter sp. QD29_5 TaxID=3398207 RepID=UPI0039F5C2B0